ncbi:MAG: bifunctional nuclease family protein [Nitrospirae bacterium]|nr:MAG: bifunctional nuclease family protein [Nitrospirota bacterium]
MWYFLVILVLMMGMGKAAAEAGESSVIAPSGDAEQVKIEKVEVKLSQLGPVVILKAQDRSIPIFVDPTVAGSIEGALTGRKFHRPLSHDLMHTILKAYGGKVDQVVIRLKDQIYYGELTISLQGQVKVFDSRSSDAIALAIHFHAPILVGKDLLERAGEPDKPITDPQMLL